MLRAYIDKQEWRDLLEEDEVDIEGDRLLEEIRNDRLNRLAHDEEY